MMICFGVLVAYCVDCIQTPKIRFSSGLHKIRSKKFYRSILPHQPSRTKGTLKGSQEKSLRRDFMPKL